MKKILFLFLIALAVGCSDPEPKLKAPFVMDEVFITENSGHIKDSGPHILADVCESKAWHNNYFGSGTTVSYNTAMDTHIFNDAGTAGTKIKKFTHTVTFTNNSSTNTVRLYKDGSAKGDIAPLGSRGILFTNNCTCAAGDCLTSVDVYYNWTVTLVSGSGSSQIAVTNSTNNGHTIDCCTGTFVFQ